MSAQAESTLTPRYITAIIDHFSPKVSKEMARVEREMNAVFPGCSIYRRVYAVDYHLASSSLWAKEDVALAYVQCRTSSGGIHSAIVWAELGTGDVRVTGWPIEEESGWGRG